MEGTQVSALKPVRAASTFLLWENTGDTPGFEPHLCHVVSLESSLQVRAIPGKEQVHAVGGRPVVRGEHYTGDRRTPNFL